MVHHHVLELLLSGRFTPYYILLLHLRNIGRVRVASVINARWGLIMRPPWLKTLSTEANVAGTSGTYSANLLNAGICLKCFLQKRTGLISSSLPTSIWRYLFNWASVVLWGLAAASHTPAATLCLQLFLFYELPSSSVSDVWYICTSSFSAIDEFPATFGPCSELGIVLSREPIFT